MRSHALGAAKETVEELLEQVVAAADDERVRRALYACRLRLKVRSFVAPHHLILVFVLVEQQLKREESPYNLKRVHLYFPLQPGQSKPALG
jgi:hypothetical protein